MKNEKITKAKVQLILNQPFFATLALGLKFEENETIKTADVDGVTIRFNPAFIETLDVEQTKGLIAHEVMHVASLHHTRRNDRDPEKWNKAADYAINQLLIDSGFKLPAGGLLNKSFTGLSAEEIYNKLPDEPKDQNGKSKNGNGKDESNSKGNPDPGGCGGVKDAPCQTQSELAQHEAQTKQLIAQAAQVAKQQGKLPAHLERLINESLEAKVNWKDVLNVFLTEITRNDYTWSKPSKRYLSMGLYLPSLESVEKGKFILMVDTSRSIDEILLNQFAGEMQSILSECAAGLTIMYIDSELHEKAIQEFESDDVLNLIPVGGGGTDFKPGFDYLEKNHIDSAAVIYFTDGCCNSFPVNPGYPVLWACYDNKSFAPKFGEVIHI